MSNESECNFGSIIPPFSNYTPDNGAMENNRVMTLKSRSDSWVVTNTMLYRSLRGYQKWDNSGPSYLTCMTHVRHVGPKQVMHKFHYSTYAFNKTSHMKKRELIPTLLRSGAVKSDGQREALIPGAVKKNKTYLSPKTKASHQHYQTSRNENVYTAT
jgi:hypothetical protein